MRTTLIIQDDLLEAARRLAALGGTQPQLRGIRRRLAALRALPVALPASQDEVLSLLDAHLLASALLSNSAIWSLDKPLMRAAESLGKDYVAPST